MDSSKAILSIVFLAALLGAAESIASEAYTTTPNIEIFVANITPNPVEPGQDLLLNVILKNTGSENLMNVSAILRAKSPFSVKTIQNDVSGKSICSDCANAMVYALSVDSKAISGTYPVEIEASYGSGDVRIVQKKAVDISIVGVPRISFDAELWQNITPKSEFDVVFDFKNTGTGNARDIKISTASQQFVIAGGTPVIDSLSAGESKKIIVSFISSPTVVPNVYSIPVSLNYVDERGSIRESSSSFGVSVLGNSDLILKNVKIEPMPVSLGKEFTITVRVQNIGYGDAKEVVMELDAPYSGYKKAFIGKLGKDEDAPAIFSLRADSLSSGAKLAIAYRDDFGEHKKTENIAINVAKVSNSTIYYIVFIIAGLAAVVYRNRILKSLRG